MTRPEVCTNDMLVYLDVLKAEEQVGFGVTELVERQFRLTPHEAVSVIAYWMATYRQDGPR